ncbi:MAG: Hsp20/alpha crystallin family protein [Simkaniaceae bacterium]|nr:MAG: Hsp20/alpha crystallin family protein [Simkaniaceae bacterium]
MLNKKFPMDNYWGNFPFHFDDESVSIASHSSGLSVYEEGDHITVEAALPGVESEAIEVSQTHGFLLIEGEKKEEETKRKYYRQAVRAFSYRVPLPAKADMSIEPEATFKDGVMKIVFKKGENKGKSIPIKEE